MYDNSYLDMFVPNSNSTVHLIHVSAELHYQLAWHAAILYEIFQCHIPLIRLYMVSDGVK